MTLKERMILDEYKTCRWEYVELGDVVCELLHKCLAELHISALSVEHRIKTEESLAGKLEKKGDKYNYLSDLTDILGARLICFFADEVDKVGKKIEEFFEVDWRNSADKRELIRSDSFGYLSVHYVCSLPANAGYPDYLCSKKFEVQIRTTLQHTWAAINHDIGYKSEFGVPRVVVRGFARLAGLLELADDEFVRVRNMMNTYVDETRKKIAENRADNVHIDSVSLREFVLHNTKMRAFLQELANISGAEIREIDPENYLEQLKWLGMTQLGDLQNMLSDNQELALKLARKSLSNAELDILSSNVGLRFLCRAELCSKNYSMDSVREFLLISTGDSARAERQAKRLFDSYRKIKES